MLKTVSTAAKVLNLFSLKQPEWGGTEVARTLGISRSSASAIMVSLAAQNLIRRTKNGRYRLSWRIAELGQIVLDTSELISETAEATLELVKDWRISVCLGRLDKTQVIVVEKIQTNPLIQLKLNHDTQLPAHCSALGKVLLAQQDWQQVTDLLAGGGLKKSTPDSATQLSILEKELEQVRNQGYAGHEEIEAGLHCLAAPIYENKVSAKTAICFSMLISQYYQQEAIYIELILKTAKRISNNLKLINLSEVSNH